MADSRETVVHIVIALATPGVLGALCERLDAGDLRTVTKYLYPKRD